jgi:HEAT repeat protein
MRLNFSQNRIARARIPGAAALIALAGFGAAAALTAQTAPQQPPHLIFPPHLQTEIERALQEMETGDPYWEETVNRALEQFQSENPEARRSAIMLLGKYPVPPARAAISQALGDSDASVRRAALVSVLEEQAPITPDIGSRMLRLLVDPDVSIRRIASSSAAALIQHAPFTMLPGDVQPRRELPSGTRDYLRRAFSDTDATVRRNMVAVYPFLRIDLPQETLVALLHDPDNEVAVHALRWALPLLDALTLRKEADRLLEHPNPLFRLELARSLQTQRDSAARDALQKLQEDEHPAVAIEAMLATLHQNPSPRLYDQLLARYRQSGGRSDAGPRIIAAANLLGPESEGYLREWLQDENPSHRQQAAQSYLGTRGAQQDLDFLMSLLEDTAPGVRQQAMQAMMRANQQVTAKHVRHAAESRYPDVRRMAAGLTAFLRPDQAEDLLMDLLLDDVTDVRLGALHQIGNRRISGWEKIMAISLEEEDPAIRQVGLDWLTRHPTPEVFRLLRDHVNRQPESPLRVRIEVFLRRQPGIDPT